MYEKCKDIWSTQWLQSSVRRFGRQGIIGGVCEIANTQGNPDMWCLKRWVIEEFHWHRINGSSVQKVSPFPMLIREKSLHILSANFATIQRQSLGRRPELSHTCRDGSAGGQCFPLQGDSARSWALLTLSILCPRITSRRIWTFLVLRGIWGNLFHFGRGSRRAEDPNFSHLLNITLLLLDR